MRLHPLPEETIAGVAHAIRNGERTCASVVEACLAKIDEYEPRVRAWVIIDRDGARASAKRLDDELQAGAWRGPLHGIALGIKDLIDVAGWPTAAGAPWLSRSAAAADAPLVARLRSAGAIVLGKTVTTQFACFDPPVTRNPWNLERTPGGSSSGSAAAVATGMCLGAVGSQTGGSITRPAAFCGVAGCKPTFGLIPLTGVVPLSASLDHAGPFARSVEDLGILLEALVDPEYRQAWRAGRPFAGDEARQSQPELPGRGLSPFLCAQSVRLGRLRGMFFDRAEPGALAVFESALARLVAAGALVGETALPPAFDDVLRCHRVVMTHELAGHHRADFALRKNEYLPGIRSLIEEGLRGGDDDYEKCQVHRRHLALDVVAAMPSVDALVCPAALGPAPSPETTGDPAFNAPWSYTHLPTVSFPIGLSADAMPLALQLVGRPFDEPKLFAVAAWCERVLAAHA